MIIGLTGGIAGGKSTITKLLRADGFYVIDAKRQCRLFKNYAQIV